mgnify:CR=1 FL=1
MYRSDDEDDEVLGELVFVKGELAKDITKGLDYLEGYHGKDDENNL